MFDWSNHLAGPPRQSCKILQALLRLRHSVHIFAHRQPLHHQSAVFQIISISLIMSDNQEQQFESNACDQCYRTKQTCTKNIPSCQRCLKTSTPCTYSFGRFMGKPKKRHKNRVTESLAAKKDLHLSTQTKSNTKEAISNSIHESKKSLTS